MWYNTQNKYTDVDGQLRHTFSHVTAPPRGAGVHRKRGHLGFTSKATLVNAKLVGSPSTH